MFVPKTGKLTVFGANMAYGISLASSSSTNSRESNLQSTENATNFHAFTILSQTFRDAADGPLENTSSYVIQKSKKVR